MTDQTAKIVLDILILGAMGYFRFRNWRRIRRLERELARTQKFVNMKPFPEV